jgi:Sulfotransferase family
MFSSNGQKASDPDPGPLVHDPLLVFGAPRSGTSMLFQALSTHPDLWSLYQESQQVIETRMERTLQDHDSEELTAADLSPEDARVLISRFFERTGNAERGGALAARLPLIFRAKLNRLVVAGTTKAKPSTIRLVDKNPQHSFRLPFLDKLFPDAKFIQITREPGPNIASIYRGWHEPRFRTSKLPDDFPILGYSGSEWCFGKPPGWRDMKSRELMEICAFQWRSYNAACLRDMPALGPRAKRVKYEDLTKEPLTVLHDIAEWADLDPAPLTRFADGLPVVNTWSRPRADKWHSLAAQIEQVTSGVSEVAEALGYHLTGSSR